MHEDTAYKSKQQSPLRLCVISFMTLIPALSLKKGGSQFVSQLT